MTTNFNKDSFSKEELRLFKAFERHGVRYLIVGMSAAILQKVNGTTQDLDIWFEHIFGDPTFEACKDAGAFLWWRSDPPVIAGPGLEDIDVVIHCAGLNDFEIEYNQALVIPIPGKNINLTVLPLERVIVSKEAANRPKDRGVLALLKDSLQILKLQEE